MIDHDPTRLTVEDRAAELEASEAEADAGLFVDGKAVLNELDEIIDRMRAPAPAGPRR